MVDSSVFKDFLVSDYDIVASLVDLPSEQLLDLVVIRGSQFPS